MAAVRVTSLHCRWSIAGSGISFSFVPQLEARALHPASTAGEAKLVDLSSQTTRSIFLFENITC